MPTLKRTLRFIFLAVTTVVGLVVVGFLLVYGIGRISASNHRDALGDQIAKRIAEDLPASQARIDTIAGQVDAKPTHSWTAQHCDFKTDDAGWMVQNYREVCSLESVRVWPAASAKEAFGLLGRQIPRDDDPYVDRPCHMYSMPRESLVDDADFSEWYVDESSFVYIEPSAVDDRWCEPTDRRFNERRVVAGDMPELDPTQGWLFVVDEKHLIDEAIGCASPNVLFCENPFRDELAWGEPPA